MTLISLRHRHAHDTALLLLRVMAGIVFAYHGAGKLFGAFGGPGITGFSGYLGSLGIPFPLINAWLAAGTEFFGGLALIAGIGVRWASIPLTVTMLVASFVVNGKAFAATNGGLEYSLTLAVVSAALGLLGAGRFSLAALVRRTATQS